MNKNLWVGVGIRGKDGNEEFIIHGFTYKREAMVKLLQEHHAEKIFTWDISQELFPTTMIRLGNWLDRHCPGDSKELKGSIAIYVQIQIDSLKANEPSDFSLPKE
jgi:hypothetical protein